MALSPRGTLFLVGALAASVRLAVAASIAGLPLVRTPKLDSGEYVAWARRMAEGQFVWPAVSAHAPGYPLFLASIFALGGSIGSALAVQALVGALTAVCVAQLARRWFGPGAGLAAGLLYATFGPAVFVETSLLAEGLLLCLLMTAVVLLSTDPLTPRVAAVAGLFLGLAALVRPTALIVAGALLVAVWFVVRGRRAAVLGALAAGMGLIVGPALAKNWHDSRTLTMQGFGGLNFYIGNSPLHNGRATFRLGAGWDELNAEARLAGATTPAEQDRYYVRKASAEIRSEPFAFLRLLAAKTLWLVQASEVRDSHSFYFFTSQSILLAILPRMAILVPFAFVGVFVLVVRRSAPPLLVAYTIGAALSVVLLVVGTRYRLPMAPSFAILAGVGVAAAVDAFRQGDQKTLMTMLAVVAAGVVAGHLLNDPSTHNVSEEWALTGSAFVTEHRLDEAETAYRQGLAADPASGLAWDGLGLALFDQQRFRESRVALERALQLDPANARAAYHLGLIDEAEDRPADAIALLRKSIDVDPTNLDAARHLAHDLVGVRRDDEAIPVLRAIVQHAPQDAAAHRELAGSLGGTGKLLDARSELNAAVGLQPSDGEAWLDLCLVTLDLGQIDEATAACRRARQLGASAERLGVAEAALASRTASRRR